MRRPRARVYGLHPRKGSIAIGADADLTLWESAHLALNHGCDRTPYKGMQIIG